MILRITILQGGSKNERTGGRGKGEVQTGRLAVWALVGRATSC